MNKLFSTPKRLFTLLAIAAVLAIIAGVYLGFLLGTPMPGMSRILPFLGMCFWFEAWLEFFLMCLRLRKGNSAFTPATGKTLRIIGWCMTALAVVTLVSALIGGSRLSNGFWLIELVILPGVFLAVAAAAKILRGLLVHAMAIEKEQEGVV